MDAIRLLLPALHDTLRVLKPWRVSPIVFGARTVVELPPGSVPEGVEGHRWVREG